jgi:hypothetical protein
MRDEPDWQALPQDLPTAVRTLIQRCLHKNRQQRIADIAVAQFLLNEPGEAATRATRAADALRPSGPATIRKSATIGLAVMAIAAAGAATLLYLRTPAKLTTRFVQPWRKACSSPRRTGASAVISRRELTRVTARDESGKILTDSSDRLAGSPPAARNRRRRVSVLVSRQPIAWVLRQLAVAAD